MLTLEEIYHGYGLLIGMTSYRLFNGSYHQSKITQAYAVILNVFLICALPFAYWGISIRVIMMPWLPGIMFIIPIVLYMVDYAVVAYILVSRFRRDSMLIDLLDLTHRLNRRMERAGLRPNPQLQRLRHLKSFTLTYLIFVSLVPLCFLETGILMALLVNIGYSILHLTTYFYFASFWQIAKGYDLINQQLGSGKTPGEEIRNLWSLHTLLGRMARRINRIYGLQMLVCRLDYILSTIIYSYVGIIIMYYGVSFLFLHATSLILLRTVDIFLNDFVCELSQRYQCQPKDEVSEGIMPQELSDFLIYESSLRVNLKICGLYSVNRSQWLQMIGFIICSFTMLMQFYLILKENN
ncbi:hypothetical protein KR054_008886 [Drosophila jambulina]|nr:hypothetical protein KR054_008886 [Drosophila jambulina]